MLHVKLTDDCPCQEGMIFRECCARTDFKPPHAVTRTPSPKTGFKNLRCYAAEFEDCSEKISREHFLSEGILKIINENQGLTVAGLPWLKTDEHRKLNPASLVGNILCERHNNALSPLDTVAIRFFKTLRQIEQEFADEKTAKDDRVFLFNGHDVERWMLKFLCGLTYSGNSSTYKGEKIINWVPKITWLNILFGNQKFSNGCGIYYEANVGEKRDLYQGVDFASLTNQDNDVVGANIGLKEHNFNLIMVQPHRDMRGTILENCIHRPTELVVKIEKGLARKVIVLGWDPPAKKSTIEMTISLLRDLSD